MSTTKKVLIPLIAFSSLIIFLAIRNFVIHPYYNKSNISYTLKNFSNNRDEYNILISYVGELAKEDSVFRFENHPKQGVNLSVLDSSKVDKKYYEPFTRKINYKTPIEIVNIFKDLKIDALNVNYAGNFRYMRIYTDLINYSMSGKTVTLYYFPKKYKFGFFNKDNTEEKMFNDWTNENNKIWLYKLDSNWILKSEKRIEN